MASLDFKPCKLSYLVIVEHGHEDENGDYIEEVCRWDGNISCGYVPAGKANEITFEDGSIRKYSYTVTLPANCREFTIGDRVRIQMIGGLMREFSVLGFQRYQLQSKMWI